MTPRHIFSLHCHFKTKKIANLTYFVRVFSLIKNYKNKRISINSCESFNVKLCFLQGWEFAYLISEWITRFLSKNEQMSYSLKKMSDSLIRSLLVSYLSDSLTIAHFL